MKKERFYSLDVFRGAAVCFMILVNNPGSWNYIYAPLKHAEWHGVTPTDLVFPFFLFAVGNAFAFVMPRFRNQEASKFWRKIIKRTLLIFLIGFLLNWMPFFMWQDHALVFKPWEYASDSGRIIGIRVFGVLQRIALAYFFSAVIVYFFKVRGSLLFSVFILLGYWLLTYLAHPADPYSLKGWFGTHIDQLLVGEPHMYHGEHVNGEPFAFDPEGLMSLFGSIVQVILGYLCGHYILKKGKTPQMANGLFVAGVLLLFLGYWWGLVYPLNKKIWTGSYAIYTTGIALLIIGVMVYFIELKGKKGSLAHFFNVFGKNPLFIFVLSGILPRISSLIHIPNGISDSGSVSFTTPLAWFYQHICRPLFGQNQQNASLLYAVILILFYWAIAYWMDRRRIYIKI